MAVAKKAPTKKAPAKKASAKKAPAKKTPAKKAAAGTHCFQGAGDLAPCANATKPKKA